MHPSNRNGFTLLEVMVAMAILAVALMAILNFQSAAVVTSGRAQEISMATMLAQHQMAQSLLELEKEMEKGKLPDDRSDQGDFSDLGYPDYKWAADMRRVEIPPPPLSEDAVGALVMKISESIAKEISEATRELTLTVSWKGVGDEEESISVTTHVVNLKGKKVGV